MRYYEVLIADGRYHSSTPLTYSWEELLPNLSVVSVPLRNRMVTGFVINEVTNPPFKVKPIKTLLSEQPLPYHCIQLAEWLRDYYSCTFGDALRQFAPAATVIKRGVADIAIPYVAPELDLDLPLTSEQTATLEKIKSHPSTSILLHGQTGSGKTRVYLEMAAETLNLGRSVLILVPEIALTAQLKVLAAQKLNQEITVLHSELSPSERKKIWFKLLEAKTPQVIIGPRSALFVPLENIGLIIVDEAHEPAYKQEQAPRYSALRVASELGLLTGSKVIMGTATPGVADYFIAASKDSVIKMSEQAKGDIEASTISQIIDLRDRTKFKKNHYISDLLIAEISHTLKTGNQALIYYNRRGSARIIMCDKCGWQLLCPNCDIPLIYHSDQHLARCHICAHTEVPPPACPVCKNPDVIYKSIGSKALYDMVVKLFPSANVKRFDSDNLPGERLNELYEEVVSGNVDILVGTQLLAKGLDLPKLNLVGVISAETSLTLPDFSSEERTYQLLYQVMGRVGRGHTKDNKIIVQTYDPESIIIRSSLAREWTKFYEHSLLERQNFRFPPYSYLLKMVCRRATIKGAENAANNLKDLFIGEGLAVEVIGPTPSFYLRRGKYFYYQLIVKSKNRSHLTKLAALAPAGWQADIDPTDLL
jgi:primosomal protein N' (replication factor Y)